MCSLGLDTWTQYLLLANTLPGFLLVLNLGNKDIVVIGFQTNGTSILELPSGPLPTIHTDVLPRSNLRSWNRPGNLHIEGSWPSTAFSSRARKTANQLPNRTSVAQNQWTSWFQWVFVPQNRCKVFLDLLITPSPIFTCEFSCLQLFRGLQYFLFYA